MFAKPFRLVPGDAERYTRLRIRMLQVSPWAFASSLEDDLSLDVEHVAKMLAEDYNAILGMEATNASLIVNESPVGSRLRNELAASAGIVRPHQRKFWHRAKLWGVFVEPSHRREGLGRAVVASAIELARTWGGIDYVDLGVSENAPDAQRLYEQLGFRAWGREPESLQHDGRRYDEIFMTLRL